MSTYKVLLLNYILNYLYSLKTASITISSPYISKLLLIIFFSYYKQRYRWEYLY